MAGGLEAIRDDAMAADSSFAAELLGEYLAGGDGSATMARSYALVTHAFMREVRPLVAKMLGDGLAPAEVRRRMLAVCELSHLADDLRPAFRATVGRVLDEELGPADVG